tara:strand:- start:178 stop:420 length:243 start_codon:yes stop_codon:yes gene_type:complete
MASKKVRPEEFEITDGPMNSVALNDAKVWAEQQDKSKHYSKEGLHRVVVAKKQQAKVSSKKHDRQVSKQIIKNLPDESSK